VYLPAVVIKCSVGGEEYFWTCGARVCAAGVNTGNSAVVVID
jgi:hypothetical protein